jgi:hypothetical protein
MHGLSSWNRRRIEQRLAEDLNEAAVAFRMANVRLLELTNAVSRGAAAGTTSQFENSNRERNQAFAAVQKASERWTAFVNHEVVPADLNATGDLRSPGNDRAAESTRKYAK